MSEQEAVVPADLWEGAVDPDGFPIEVDDVYGEDIAPAVHTAAIAGATEQENIAASYRLPEEFWGARELFKRVRQAAWANQAHPDATLACVLARAAAAIGHEIKFDSGRGPTGTLSLFVCLLAKSGIGKSEAYKAAELAVRLPRHLLDLDGGTNIDVFLDGAGLGSGEGVAEAFMGWVERDTGRMKPGRRGQPPEPEMVKVRAVTRHRAFFYVDEGAMLATLMNERKGSTLGPTLRTAWSGGSLSQTGAKEETTRYVRGGVYSIGIAIGYQPSTAVDLLADVGPGTPQRFLWFGAQDTEMPETRTEWPEPIDLLPEGMPAAGVIDFPDELKDWFFHYNRAKHLGEVEFDEMDSHESLMRAKLTALLCYLDGRMMVNRDDWILAGMIWSMSKAIRNRLIRHRDQNRAEAERIERERRLSEATEIEVMKVQVSSDVERVARRIHKHVSEAADRFEIVKRYALRKTYGRDRQFFDVALSHAKSMNWVVSPDDDATLEPGCSAPA